MKKIYMRGNFKQYIALRHPQGYYESEIVLDKGHQGYIEAMLEYASRHKDKGRELY